MLDGLVEPVVENLWLMSNLSVYTVSLYTVAVAVTRYSPLSLGSSILKFDCIMFTGLSTSVFLLTFNMTIRQPTIESDFARRHLAFKMFPLLSIVKLCRYLTSVNYKYDDVMSVN